MKKFLTFLCAVMPVLGMIGSAGAVSFQNGSFETGDFTGWDVITSAGGSVSVVTGNSGFGPTDGTYFANLVANSKISQDQIWSAGETISFDWNFNANDYLPFNDYSIFSIISTNGSMLFNYTLANVAATGNFNATGWNTYQYTFATAGSGSIGFGVYNFGDTIYDSQLYIDNVGGTAPVPEPATILLMGSGLLGLVGYSCKRKKS